jgi:hypothetical protein
MKNYNQYLKESIWDWLRGYEEIERHPGFYFDKRGNLFGKVDGIFVPVDGHGNPLGGQPTFGDPYGTQMAALDRMTMDNK